MKKRLIVILATLMCISLCACGGSEGTSGNNKGNGFTPDQTTVKEETDEGNAKIEEVIDEENLEKYYDVTECIGTPRLAFYDIVVKDPERPMEIIVYNSKDDWINNKRCLAVQIEYNKDVPYGELCYCIITDNYTPDDTSDDQLAYIFTTPIEK